MPSLAGTAGYNPKRVQPNEQEEEERLALLQAALAEQQQGEQPNQVGTLFGGAGAALAEPQEGAEPENPVGALFGGIEEDATRSRRVDRLQDTGFLTPQFEPTQEVFQDARLASRAAIAIRKLQEMRERQEEQERRGVIDRSTPLSSQL